MNKMKNFVLVAACFLIAVIGLGSIYMKKPVATIPPPITIDTKSVIISVSKLMMVPQGDDPIVYEIKDPASLQSQQAFFAGSIVGDQLLVYPKSAKAIIYSPSRNLIVNVGPMNFDQGATSKK